MANRVASGRRMDKEWNSLLATVTNFTASSTAAGASLAPGTTATVLRMIGEYLITGLATGTFSAGDQARITVAIGVVSTDAFAAGAASLPDPASEPEYPWLFWASHQMHWLTASSDLFGPSEVVRRSFDSRSMRKMKPRETLAYVVQYADVSGAPPIEVFLGQTRILFGGI